MKRLVFLLLLEILCAGFCIVPRRSAHRGHVLTLPGVGRCGVEQALAGTQGGAGYNYIRYIQWYGILHIQQSYTVPGSGYLTNYLYQAADPRGGHITSNRNYIRGVFGVHAL